MDYVFVLKDGKRVTSLVVGVHGNSPEEILEGAKLDYPDREFLTGDDEYQDNFMKGLIWDTDKFVEPPIDMEALKAGRIAYLKARRDALEVEPLEYKGKLYDYDNKARERLSIARTALEDMGGEGTQAWTTYDNSVVFLSLEDFKALNKEAALRSGNLHIKYNKMKEEVAKAETPGDLERIDY